MMLHLNKLIGALTSKPYAFTARSWELKNVDSLDVFDAVGSNIKISTRGSSVLRVLPKINDQINEEWISDKARFSYDALKFQRILYCFKKVNKTVGSNLHGREATAVGHHFQQINWPKFFSWFKKASFLPLEFNSKPISKTTKPPLVNFLCGPFSDLSTLQTASSFCRGLRVHDYRLINSSLPFTNLDFRSNFLLGVPLSKIDSKDACILVGCNPRLEAPALNLRLRKAVLSKTMLVYNIGFNSALTYKFNNLGNSVKSLASILEGKSKFNKKFTLFSNPLILFGTSFLQIKNSHFILDSFRGLISSHNKNISCSVMLNEASSANFLELAGPNITNKFLTTPSYISSLFWFLNEDKSIVLGRGKAKVSIYQGHHGDFNSGSSDVILPSTIFSEKNSTYINFNGLVQKTRFANSSVLTKDVRDDNLTLKTLSSSSSQHPMADNSILFDDHSSVGPFYSIATFSGQPSTKKIVRSISSGPISYYMEDFYRNDPISRNSPIMALTSNRINSRKSSFAK